MPELCGLIGRACPADTPGAMELWMGDGVPPVYVTDLVSVEAALAWLCGEPPAEPAAPFPLADSLTRDAIPSLEALAREVRRRNRALG